MSLNVIELFPNYKAIISQTRKRFSEKPIVAFANSIVFILGFSLSLSLSLYIYIYVTKPVWSQVLALSAWNLKQGHITRQQIFRLSVACQTIPIIYDISLVSFATTLNH